MKTFLSILAGGAFLLSFAPGAHVRAEPHDSQPGAGRLFLRCTPTEADLSSKCRIEYPTNDQKDGVRADSEITYVDQHPFTIVDATPGIEVRVFVRLKISPTASGFDVQPSNDLFLMKNGVDIVDPIWIHSPQGRWARPYFPEKAFRLHQKGQATVRCLTTAEGLLVNCWVQEEQPSDFGFGWATALIMAHAQMKPLTASGSSVAGRVYTHTAIFDGEGGVQ